MTTLLFAVDQVNEFCMLAFCCKLNIGRDIEDDANAKRQWNLILIEQSFGGKK
jgi:hypothetical protein